MKILLSARQFTPPLVGGVDVYADRLGRALQRLGHEVSLIAVGSTAVGSTAENSNGAITVASESYNGMPVYRLQFAFAGRPKEAFDNAFDPEMGQVIGQILEEQKPDLFVVLNFYMVTLAAVAAAKSRHIPVAHVATDFLPICRRATFIRWDGRSCETGESVKTCATCFVSHHPLGRAAAAVLNRLPEDRVITLAKNQSKYAPPHPLSLFKPYWKQAAIMEKRLQTLRSLRGKIDFVLTPTQYTRKQFIENGFRQEQVHFLPFGVEPDHPLTQVKHSSAPHTRFLFIGRFQPYKGAHLLLAAFNNLAAPKGATLTLYGSADGYEDYYEQVKAMMAKNDRVFFRGRIPPEELHKAFAETDYFVIPSTWHENSPLIVLDALQSKTPVISSDIGGVTDMVKDRVNGLLFPMGDASALQQVLQHAIDQPSLVEELRSGVALPGIDAYTDILLQLYRGVSS